MDYGAFPPEVNSARMYGGPGAGSMLAAAGAWDGLAADLHATAAAAGSVVSGLTGGAGGGGGGGGGGGRVDVDGRRGCTVFDVDERDRRTIRAGGQPGQGGSQRLRGGVRDGGAAGGYRRQPGSADGAGSNKFPGSEHAGDHGHRGSLRSNVGPGRRGHVQLRRQLGGSLDVG